MATCLHLALCCATFWASLIPVFCLIQHNSLICCFSQVMSILELPLVCSSGIFWSHAQVNLPTGIWSFTMLKQKKRIGLTLLLNSQTFVRMLYCFDWSLANVTLLQPFSFFLVFAHSAAKLGKDLLSWWT